MGAGSVTAQVFALLASPHPVALTATTIAAALGVDLGAVQATLRTPQVRRALTTHGWRITRQDACGVDGIAEVYLLVGEPAVKRSRSLRRLAAGPYQYTPRPGRGAYADKRLREIAAEQQAEAAEALAHAHLREAARPAAAA